ncbi:MULTISPECIES: YoaK family protein [Sphingobium]|uniref:YoaK family protein n=1 Tax=Sphingobium TaxID=165695 RepID=UPI0015EC4907|nr:MULTISPECIES: YoaK family protein [Sphingobium]MCW2362956.1 uncharacterized membrane protein YoaK (UPF0700 family) [Sphingobium sp. B10D3B]MCW2400364.1 uncharacterized membrane protein YoaK (UPF0700 family) [Sphingobium sp. B10D7B]MCW2407342.1 uncharacterized membrane protein YoaK (UPF0700 family) [Sphingobium xanthum]
MLRSDARLLSLAIALSALAGFVDALGFLTAGGFFVSFMSGNSTRLAVGISEGSHAALTAASLIAGFVTGVVIGGLVGHHAKARRRSAVLALVTALLLVAALSAPVSPTLALAAMVMAMGAENAALADNGEVKVGLTYMTGALVRLGQALANRLTGKDASHWRVDLGLWSGLMTGAITGALAYASLGFSALWIAAGLALTLTLLAARFTSAPR